MDKAANNNTASQDADPAHSAPAPAPAAVRPQRRRVLLVCADPLLARELQRGLERCDVDSTLLAEAGASAAAAAAADCDAIVFDLGSVDARRHLRQLRAATGLPLLAVHGLGGSAAAQEEAIVCGAQLLARPLSGGALAAALTRACVEQRRRERLEYHQQCESRHAGLAHLIGESTPMLRLRARLRLWLDWQWRAPAEAPRFMLLHGECGTGKQQIARALHHDGPRCGAAFVSFDAGGLSARDIETRLFGTVRRATGGSQEHGRGLLGVAEGGTLFIREIADIALQVQDRLAERIAVASPTPSTAAAWAPTGDVQLIASSRLSPDQLSAGGALCRALAASLLPGTLAVPPLHERGDDVCFLARHFARALAEQRGLPMASWQRRRPL